jgi:hypothetical protein
MRNHFRLVLETSESNLVDGMSWLLNACEVQLKTDAFRQSQR